MGANHQMMLAGSSAVKVTFDPTFLAANTSLSNGNETATSTAAQTSGSCVSTTSKSSGKWYFEILVGTVSTNSRHQMFGVRDKSSGVSDSMGGTNGWAVETFGDTIHNSSGVANIFTTGTNGTVYGVAWDATAGKLWFSKNNTFVGSPSAGTGQSFSSVTGTLFAGATAGESGVVTSRFNASEMSFSPPSGFSAWAP